MNAIDELNNGWRGMQGPSPKDAHDQALAVYEAEVAAWEFAQKVKKTFGTAAGKDVLATMTQTTIMQPAFILGQCPMDDGSLGTLPADQQGFIREGQNSLVRYFHEQIKLAEQPKPDAPVLQEDDEDDD